jgi:hypothetical protein
MVGDRDSYVRDTRSVGELCVASDADDRAVALVDGGDRLACDMIDIVRWASSRGVNSCLGERNRRRRDSGVSRENKTARPSRSSGPTGRKRSRVPSARTSTSDAAADATGRGAALIYVASCPAGGCGAPSRAAPRARASSRRLCPSAVGITVVRWLSGVVIGVSFGARRGSGGDRAPPPSRQMSACLRGYRVRVGSMFWLSRKTLVGS